MCTIKNRRHSFQISIIIKKELNRTDYITIFRSDYITIFRTDYITIFRTVEIKTELHLSSITLAMYMSIVLAVSCVDNEEG